MEQDYDVQCNVCGQIFSKFGWSTHVAIGHTGHGFISGTKIKKKSIPQSSTLQRYAGVKM